jgi:hypothetical protein
MWIKYQKTDNFMSQAEWCYFNAKCQVSVRWQAIVPSYEWTRKNKKTNPS